MDWFAWMLIGAFVFWVVCRILVTIGVACFICKHICGKGKDGTDRDS